MPSYSSEPLRKNSLNKYHLKEKIIQPNISFGEFENELTTTMEMNGSHYKTIAEWTNRSTWCCTLCINKYECVFEGGDLDTLYELILQEVSQLHAKLSSYSIPENFFWVELNPRIIPERTLREDNESFGAKADRRRL